jgi:PAS domain S-box-containing protein
MLGYSHAEFLGKKLWEVGTFADIPQSKEMLLEIQTNGYVRYDDLPLKSKAGAQIAVEFVSNSYDCEGIKVIQCNIRNITERKFAESEVLREKNFIRAALNNLPSLFYLIDDRDRFLRWNRNFETVSGYSAEEISKLTPVDLFAGSDKEPVTEAIKKAFLGGEATVEAEFVAKNGARTPYFFTGAGIEIDEKPCLIGMGIDVTERRLAAKALQTSMEEFGTLAEAIPQIVWITRPDGWTVYINQQWVDYTGLAEVTVLERQDNQSDSACGDERRGSRWRAMRSGRARGQFRPREVAAVRHHCRDAQGGYRSEKCAHRQRVNPGQCVRFHDQSSSSLILAVVGPMGPVPRVRC